MVVLVPIILLIPLAGVPLGFVPMVLVPLSLHLVNLILDFFIGQLVLLASIFFYQRLLKLCALLDIHKPIFQIFLDLILVLLASLILSDAFIFDMLLGCEILVELRSLPDFVPQPVILFFNVLKWFCDL